MLASQHQVGQCFLFDSRESAKDRCQFFLKCGVDLTATPSGLQVTDGVEMACGRERQFWETEGWEQAGSVNCTGPGGKGRGFHGELTQRRLGERTAPGRLPAAPPGPQEEAVSLQLCSSRRAGTPGWALFAGLSFLGSLSPSKAAFLMDSLFG